MPTYENTLQNNTFKHVEHSAMQLYCQILGYKYYRIGSLLFLSNGTKLGEMKDFFSDWK